MQKPPDTSTVLLIEDSIDDYDATVRGFTKAHFLNPIHWCVSGEDALSYLRREGEYATDWNSLTPGLILLDLNMPGLDGKKTLEILKQDQNLKHIPVVVLTTSADENDMTQCYKLGANTYIPKPVDFEGFVEVISGIKEYWFGTAILPSH